MGKFLQPQEIEVWYILPVIRRELAFAMKRKGLTGKRIADLLGISEAAVSQYFSNKRAKEISLKEKIKEYINDMAEEIIKQPVMIIPYTQAILKMFWNDGIVCDLHKEHCKDLPEDCESCMLHE